ncbi:hypothetical protein TUM20984_24470 [Mycobacterium antarcticum]|nr:hypothetical protein TUM20984_24470 [Mycolicibacterium sp. TUM20984]
MTARAGITAAALTAAVLGSTNTACSASHANPDITRTTTTAAVLRIVDGDTVDVVEDTRGRLRIRVLGIDTPETKKPGGTAWRVGAHKQANSRTTPLPANVSPSSPTPLKTSTTAPWANSTSRATGLLRGSDPRRRGPGLHLRTLPRGTRTAEAEARLLRSVLIPVEVLLAGSTIHDSNKAIKRLQLVVPGWQHK